MSEPWKRCSSCRKDLDFGESYYACSVSTCQRKRTGLYFCSLSCWDAHLATANHREAWAEEKRAPSRAQWEAENSGDKPSSSKAPAKERKVIAPAKAASSTDALPRDILIVVSKLKKYIAARSGMRTSDGCADALSDHVRTLCDRAIRVAGEHERKTVLDRDFQGLL